MPIAICRERVSYNTARSGRRVQSGLVRSYALGVLGGAVLIVAFLVFRP